MHRNIIAVGSGRDRGAGEVQSTGFRVCSSACSTAGAGEYRPRAEQLTRLQTESQSPFSSNLLLAVGNRVKQSTTENSRVQQSIAEYTRVQGIRAEW